MLLYASTLYSRGQMENPSRMIEASLVNEPVIISQKGNRQISVIRVSSV